MVPRKLAEAESFCIFSRSWGGGAGGLRLGVLGSLPRGGSSNVKDSLKAWLVDKDREIGRSDTLAYLKAQGSRPAIAVMLRKNNVEASQLTLQQSISTGLVGDKLHGQLRKRSLQTFKISETIKCEEFCRIGIV